MNRYQRAEKEIRLRLETYAKIQQAFMEFLESNEPHTDLSLAIAKAFHVERVEREASV